MNHSSGTHHGRGGRTGGFAGQQAQRHVAGEPLAVHHQARLMVRHIAAGGFRPWKGEARLRSGRIARCWLPIRGKRGLKCVGLQVRNPLQRAIDKVAIKLHLCDAEGGLGVWPTAGGGTTVLSTRLFTASLRNDQVVTCTASVPPRCPASSRSGREKKSGAGGGPRGGGSLRIGQVMSALWHKKNCFSRVYGQRQSREK